MSRSAIVGATALPVSACGSLLPATIAVAPAVVATPTSIPATPPPAATSDTRAAAIPTPSHEAGDAVSLLAGLPGNIARGEKAINFSARALGSGTVRLSEQRRSPILLFPSAVGCGDCVSPLLDALPADELRIRLDLATP